MSDNYFIYAVEYEAGGLVPVVLDVQELTTDPESGAILGAFGIGYSIESPAGACVAVPGHLLTSPLEGDFAETLIYHIRRHRRCFVPRALSDRMPRMALERGASGSDASGRERILRAVANRPSH
jgi:hypothetical protein